MSNSSSPKGKDKYGKYVGVVFNGLIVIITFSLVILVWYYLGFVKFINMNPTDRFALIGSLFSGLAVASLLITIYLQNKQLKLQQKQLEDQKQEMKYTQEEVRRTTEAQEETRNAMQFSAWLNALPVYLQPIDAEIKKWDDLIKETEEKLKSIKPSGAFNADDIKQMRQGMQEDINRFTTEKYKFINKKLQTLQKMEQMMNQYDPMKLLNNISMESLKRKQMEINRRLEEEKKK